MSAQAAGKMLGSQPVLRGRPYALPLAALCLAAAACEGPPAADTLKEWTPGDHHSSDDDKSGPQGAQGARQPSGSDVPQLVELAWRTQCTSCHGPMGKGDGQMGAIVQAPDLTRDDLQASLSDVEMAALIKKGKNKMPPFNLPDPVIQGLVARVRQLRGR